MAAGRVLGLAFPRAFVCGLDQSEPQLPGVRAAINYGVQQIYTQAKPIAELVSSLLPNSQHSKPQ